MELETRKPIRLENYDYSQNGAYFIPVCVKGINPILSKIVGDYAYIDPQKYGKIVEKYIRNVPEIRKYIIMPDHIHFIIHIENGPMWASSPTNRVATIVRSLKTLTTKEIGKSIFQRSYYDHVIRNQNDYNEIWEYIENNPKKYVLKQTQDG